VAKEDKGDHPLEDHSGQPDVVLADLSKNVSHRSSAYKSSKMHASTTVDEDDDVLNSTEKSQTLYKK